MDVSAAEAPVESALASALAPDLSCLVKPGYVVVTTKEMALRDLSAAALPLGNLFDSAREKTRPGTQAGEWCDRIRKRVCHRVDPCVAEWLCENGCASVQCFRGILVVVQTRTGQRLVNGFLAECRSAAGTGRT